MNFEKTTLVIWTWNGGRYLPKVLGKINQIIPPQYVADKFIVDDKSTDNTVAIAKKFGWRVIPNRGHGISDGANTALENVKTDFFCSFEQDVVLADEWWIKTLASLKRGASVVSGVRFDVNKSIRALDEFSFERFQALGNKAGVDGYLYGRTLDNTMYVTKDVKALGGFPKLAGGAGVDTLLSLNVVNSGLKWTVNYNVVSTHLRKNLVDTLRHYVWYGRNFPELERHIGHKHVNIYRQLYRFVASPARGVDIALKKKRWQLIFVYPMIRFCILNGIFQGLKGDYK